MDEGIYTLLREKRETACTIRDYRKYSLLMAPHELKVSLKSICAFFQYSVSSYYRLKSSVQKTSEEEKASWGGRRKSYMSTKQEKEMIEELGVVAEKAGFVDISKIKEKFEKLSGQSVHKTTIYRFLERHGFRKIAPRKYHPKQNKETQEAFKKTSLT